MSRKADLKKAIEESEQNLADFEQRRERSQAALLLAYLDKTEPDENDTEYYRVFTELIALERENLKKLKAELQKLEDK